MKKIKIIYFTFITLLTLSLFSCSESETYSPENTVNSEDILSVDVDLSECNIKSECKAGFYCDKTLRLCKEGDCFDNSDCNQGYLCDSARHYCYFAGCSKNSDCKEGICKRNTGKCVGCLTDADCKSGNCNSATGICLLNNCIDDKLEPNDSFSQTYIMESGIRKLKLCPSDDDYFKVSLSPQDRLRIGINTSSIKPISLYLFSEKDTSNPISYTSIENHGELTLSSAPTSGFYYIKLAASDIEINYEIEIDVTNKTNICEDDIFENNDTESSAKNITSGTYKNLILCPDDDDFYSLNLNMEEILNLKISGENLIAEFYKESNDIQNIAINNQTNINIEYSGLYFLKISSTSKSPVKYSIEINTGGTPSCDDDNYEENDSLESSTDLILNKEVNLSLCIRDDDWFIIKTYGRHTTIELRSSSTLQFEIYSLNDRNEPILYSDEISNGISIADFENLPDTLYIRVPSQDTKIEYTLKVTSDTVVCTDDSYEPNDTYNTAVDIPTGDINSLMLCPADEDNYGFDLNKDDQITIETTFDKNQADIDIVLFDPQSNEAAYSISSTGTEKINYTAKISGRHILNVFAWDNKSAQYSLESSIIRSSTCTDDRLEDNDSINTATIINSTEIYGLKICPSDYDYYSIILNKGDRLSTGVFYNESNGKLYSALLSSDGKTVFANGEDQSGDIVLDITAPYSGEYILLIRGISPDIMNDYDILIDIKRDTQCTDDIYEENDSFQYAPDIAKGIMDNLILCQQDTDVYKIYTYSGDTILVESTVIDSDMADYSITLYDSSGRILDTSGGNEKTKSVITEAAYKGYYYIELKNITSINYKYRLSLQIDGSGGTTGEETEELFPIEILDKNNPALYELKFLRVPQNTVVENLYLSIIVEHKSLSDIIITAQYSDAPEEVLWDGFGGRTDMGFDDDNEDDSDIELYFRPISSAKGKTANDSLLIMIEDFSNTSGTIFAIQANLFWRLK